MKSVHIVNTIVTVLKFDQFFPPASLEPKRGVYNAQMRLIYCCLR
jgi:hypothetical protein